MGSARIELPYQWTGGEIRVGGKGGVVGPYSRHTSGLTYDPLSEMLVETLPSAWVHNLIASGRRRTRVHDEAAGPGDDGWSVTEPGRHTWVLSMAGRLRRNGLGDEVLRDSLHYLNNQRCDPPLPDDEVDEIAAWASGKEAGTAMDANGPPASGCGIG